MKADNLSEQLTKELAALEAEGCLRSLPECDFVGSGVRAPEGAHLLNLSSNDYLGLASEDSLIEEFVQKLPEMRYSGEFLFSSTSSRLLTGNRKPYPELEALLCRLYGRDSALVFNSGYHMNSGILPALADSRSLILADKLVHASIIDGIRLATAHCIRYRHNDYRQLETLLEKYRNEYSRIFIVTESVFSMDGDVCDLPRLVELKRRYTNAVLYVDEAHAVGVSGKDGLGLADETSTIGDIDLLCGTFGKAVASMGGYILCSRPVREYLVNRMRTLIFTTALPPVNVAWTKFVMERIPDMKDRRSHLAEISGMLRNALSEAGFDSPSQSHIVPMVVGGSIAAGEAALEMRRQGFYVLPIRPPTVPEGTSRLRFSLTASVSVEDTERLCEAVRKCKGGKWQ